jgi:hypothetical protein
MNVVGMDPVPQDGSSHARVFVQGEQWNLRDDFELRLFDVDAELKQVTFTFRGGERWCRFLVREVVAVQVGDLPELDDSIDLMSEDIGRLDSFAMSPVVSGVDDLGWFSLSTDGGFVVNIQTRSVLFESSFSPRDEVISNARGYSAEGRSRLDQCVKLLSFDIANRAVRLVVSGRKPMLFRGVRFIDWSSWRDLESRSPVNVHQSEIEPDIKIVIGAESGLRMSLRSGGHGIDGLDA